MKPVSMRRQEVPDLVAPAVELDMVASSARAYSELLSRIYGGPEALQQMLGVPDEDVEAEALRRGEAVIKALVASRRS